MTPVRRKEASSARIGRRDAALGSQHGEKGLDLLFSHGARVAHARPTHDILTQYTYLGLSVRRL